MILLLTELCNRYDNSFEQVRLAVESLNPFGTLTRYPSQRADPDQKTTQEAISNGETILRFIQDRILS